MGIVFVAHRHLANWDTHYETEITKIAEKAELWWRGLKFVLTVSQEQREGAALDPERPDFGAQRDSRCLIPTADVIALKIGCVPESFVKHSIHQQSRTAMLLFNSAEVDTPI
jgi:hypothetical protein